MTRPSALREQLAKEGRDVGRSLMKREKNKTKNGSFWNTSADSEEVACD